jgi:hypothetical protein
MTTQQEALARFTEELNHVDDVAQIILKGHLVMEGLMNESIETFLLHGELVEIAGLRVHQKITLSRAISTSDQNNKMWELVSKVNTVRNALAHSLEPTRRSRAIQELRTIYVREFKDAPDTVEGIPKNIEQDIPPDTALCLYAVSAGIGYLHAHLSEVRRLKSWIVDLDMALNKGALQKHNSANAASKAAGSSPPTKV